MKDKPMTTQSICEPHPVFDGGVRRKDIWKARLMNLWNWRTAWAVKHLSKQLQKDKAYRDSWQANVAMAIYDAYPDSKPRPLVRLDHHNCKHMAERVMKGVFGG